MKIKFIAGLLIVSLSLVAFWSYQKSRENPTFLLGETTVAEKNDLPIITQKDSFYDTRTLLETIAKVKVTPRQDTFAVITPHHFLVAEKIADIIGSASGRTVKNVFIIGPNHENISSDTLATAKAVWQTPFGLVRVNRGLVDQVVADFHLTPNVTAFENEHSIGTIVPFVAHYFPQAKIVPIIITSHAGIEEAQKLSQWLSDNTGEDSLVIFSTDFSHYLTKEISDQKDAETKQLIEDKNIERIARLDNNNVDCPTALATSLLYAQKKNLASEIVWNGNSFDFSREKPSRTTSYFTLRFNRAK